MFNLLCPKLGTPENHQDAKAESIASYLGPLHPSEAAAAGPEQEKPQASVGWGFL